MRALITFLATGLYSGYAPYAPGTAGSLVGALLVWAVTAPLTRRSPVGGTALIAAMFAAGCWLAGRAEEILGRCDSPHIVIDEIVGMAITMYLNPASWSAIALGFALFRLFDIAKLEPARAIDRRMRGGAAVMLDDVAAAIYANLVLRALCLAVPL
ncbi:MAG TPA: phosphatidylglycerophosphatase A [Candidatus Binataceae bacterium]|jgi:phosphatidylglycerophosphatase A|nr:phosphatidylglycerophosphatase A [Candidatus Binataceae bacterium]